MAYRGLNKYHAQKTVVDGIAFASAKEARRFRELKLMQAAGEIKDLRIQVPFVLIPSQVIRDDRGRKIKTERACKYVADFVYWDCHRRRKVVEDTKGVRTKEYIIKKKLMLYVHGIVIYEV